MKTINVFWTGGLDSTYRIFELSLTNCIIQPYYINDYLRKSSKIELNAIEKQRNILLNNKNCKAVIKDLIVIDRRDLTKYDDITNAYWGQHKIHKCGYQYMLTAMLCRQLNIKCEICTENEPGNHVRKAITSLNVTTTETDSDYVFRFNDDNNLDILFRDILFPKTVWHINKREEINCINSKLPELLKCIHFCHNSIDGKPCGECHPCRDYKAYNLFELFT